MSFPGVMEIIGILQLVSSCALALYAFAAWRRKPPAPKIRTRPRSVPETLKLLSDLQQLSTPPPRWKLRSPLTKAEEELWGPAEVLRRESTPDPLSAPSVTEQEKVFRRSNSIEPESTGPRVVLTPSSPATHPPASGPQPLSSALHSYAKRHG